MKYIPNAVTRTAARTTLKVGKHSPTILFGVGIVGVVTATVLACRSTLKLEEVLLEHGEKLDDINSLHHAAADMAVTYDEEQAAKDKLTVYVHMAMDITKLYGPAIVVGAISIGCLTQSHRVLSRRNAALTAAYATIEKAFKNYRARVVEEYGEDKDRELYFGTEKITVIDADGKKSKRVVAQAPSGYAKFFDDTNPDWSTDPSITFLFLKAQEKYANDKLRASGHVFLNEIYDALNLERTKAGQVVGWVRGHGDDWIDFGLFDNDSREGVFNLMTGREKCVLLDFNVDGNILDLI